MFGYIKVPIYPIFYLLKGTIVFGKNRAAAVLAQTGGRGGIRSLPESDLEITHRIAARNQHFSRKSREKVGDSRESGK